MSYTTLNVYNSLNRKKEVFKSQTEGYIGMYVCGPTVYSDVHLGNCRTFVSFDIIYRYLLFLGYKVRYVRNITDVGHLLDGGEDRILKGARLEQLEPMEVVQKYTNGFHDMMDVFNTLRPSIEPRATGHIIEQIQMVQDILDNGFGYVKNGSVYFDTIAFIKADKPYGKLSGRIIEELHAETRELKGQEDKNHPSDFAIWMKASPEHIMKWPSPWSEGFPGWHLECSAMSTKYLGQTFDIHGGGNDLKFPHHENEIAQNVASCHCQPANYWLHTNMLLMNGRKMSKSDGNTISPDELFSGDSIHVSKGYSPMVIRFFMLQTHYSSTLDLTDSALLAAEKGFNRLMTAYKHLQNLTTDEGSTQEDASINALLDDTFNQMSDDFNTPRALASLFEIVTKINSFKDKKLDVNQVSKACLNRLKTDLHAIIFDVFGLKDDMEDGNNNDVLKGVMELVVELRKDARSQKDYATSDKIRDALAKVNIQINDGKDGTEWNIN